MPSRFRFKSLALRLKSLLKARFRHGRVAPRPTTPPSPPRVNMTPLPMSRIDIHDKPLAEQPQSCLLLDLPLELRECIYDAALCGRWIRIKAEEKQNRLVSRWSWFDPFGNAEDIDEAGDTDSLKSDPTAEIPISLLLTCRQVHIEALPILYQRTTFCFPALNFDSLFDASLGRYSLLNIRRLSIYVPYMYGGSYDFDDQSTWPTVFPLIHKMPHLESLALDFGKTIFTASGFFADSEVKMHTVWAHAVLSIRGLRHFRLSIKFVEGVSPEREREIEQRFQRLMVGPGADERYQAFLEDWLQGK
ncbi:hypothetical protein MSAN_00414200 [Mycena sanguinolenta]|uniref:DUF7730 domain-containing protein n=1 Tax=Mycena sanguinolenta TaxID=230812 RepID=A0A8H6ZDF5_9AGAR|nr:hypothetical protein MSAN_00414200 [Mycena sanguinolenta]